MLSPTARIRIPSFPRLRTAEGGGAAGLRRPTAAALAGGILALAAGLTLAGCGSGAVVAPPLAHDTLERKVMVGYQGWFRTPADGAQMGWAHYQQSGTSTFGPGHLSVDFWPEVSELPAASRVDTAFTLPNGAAAQVFSSHDRQVVDLHFRWMRDYGIDGAFVQRFTEPIIGDDESSHTRRRASDNVLRYTLAAAERYGRSVAVMYDLSGQQAGMMERVMQDWRHVVDDLGARRSPAAQRHRGRPVVAVWGVGFDDGRAYSLAETGALIDFLKNDPVYGGNTVMLGIPSWWRERSADAVADPALHAVLRKADILSPWTPGRYYDIGGVQAHAERLWAPDQAWCRANGIDYMPVVFPGFSWRNLKGTVGGIDRNDGRFLWAQYRELTKCGVTMIYQAMFDEMDEGTQIFKTSGEPPRDAFLETYHGLPADYYLWLVGQAGDFLRRGVALPERIIDRAAAPQVNRYLRSRDAVAYADVPASFDAQRSFFQIADALVTRNGSPVKLDGAGAQVQATGRWHWRYLWSNDPTARIAWEMAIPASGEYAIEVRYPGDPNRDHATAARLRIMQNNEIIAEHRLNLREHALHWVSLPGRLALQGGVPCRIVLDQDAATGPLVLFEPRLMLRP